MNRLPTEAEILTDPTFVHTVSISGGKDSTATYCKALEAGVRFIPVAADTGNENAVTYEQIANLPEWTGGPAVHWVRADLTDRIVRKREYIAANWHKPGRQGEPPVSPERIAEALRVLDERLANPGSANPYLDLCLWKGLFPSRKAQFCTEVLKVEPIQKWQADMLRAGAVVISWQGVRAAESFERRDLPMIQELDAETVCGAPVPGRLIAYRPLIHVETVDEVFAIAARHGVPRNPLYDLGASRVGCWPCINCVKAELVLVASSTPQDIDRLTAWEKMVSRVSRRGAATFFTVVNDPVMAQEIAYARGAGEAMEITPETHGIRRMVEWAKTDRGGRQYRLFDDPIPSPACNAHGMCE